MSNVAEIFDNMTYGPAPEADAAARAWLASHSARFGLFIRLDETGADGIVLATGSIYLVADLLRPAGAGRASML